MRDGSADLPALHSEGEEGAEQPSACVGYWNLLGPAEAEEPDLISASNPTTKDSDSESAKAWNSERFWRKKLLGILSQKITSDDVPKFAEACS